MTKPIFDDTAQKYDSWYDTPTGRAVDHVEHQVFASLFKPNGKKILEIGCGTGLYTLRMAEQGFDITALDISPEMMKIAREKIQKSGKEARFILGDIKELLDDLESYHGIFSMTAFEFIPEPETILKKLYKKLHPDGCLVIGVIADNSSWSTLYRESAKADPGSVFSHAHFFTEEEIRSWDIGPDPEILKSLYFSPDVASYEKAIEQEEQAQEKPGFLVACWRK